MFRKRMLNSIMEINSPLDKKKVLYAQVYSYAISSPVVTKTSAEVFPAFQTVKIFKGVVFSSQ